TFLIQYRLIKFPVTGSPSGDVAIGVDLVANQLQRLFKVPARRAERIGVDGQGCTQNNERGTVLRAANRLFERQTTNRLHRNADGGDHLAQLIQRAGHTLSLRGDSASLVVSDVVNDIITPEILQPFGGSHHVGASQVVAHDTHP